MHSILRFFNSAHAVRAPLSREAQQTDPIQPAAVRFRRRQNLLRLAGHDADPGDRCNAWRAADWSRKAPSWMLQPSSAAVVT